MIVLDTNVVSEMTRLQGNRLAADWLSRQDRKNVYICGPVVMEQAYGAEKIALKTGSLRYHRSLESLVDKEFRDRVLEFDSPAPYLAGKLRAGRESIGRPLSIVDSMIAAICLVHDATLATRNMRDFELLDLKLINPFEPQV